MSTAIRRVRWLGVILLIALPSPRASAWGRQMPPASRARVIREVNQTVAGKDSGGFAAARAKLEGSFAGCPPGAQGVECRALYASGLGALLQRQAGVDRRNRDALYLESLGWYNRILAEVPGNREAVYGKAVVYRAMGPQAGQESFFADAVKRDPGRGGLYLAFQGDYHAAKKDWRQAATAYRAAVLADPDVEGARSGLIEVLPALGLEGRRELVARGGEWALRYPESSADAYAAALSGEFADGGRIGALAEAAVAGLVSVQARNRRTVGAVPAGVPADWPPVKEIRAFVETPGDASVVWWTASPDRQDVLGQVALARGRQAVASNRAGDAERLWQEGVRVTRPTSTIALDLQRELALLYHHHPALDPIGAKFKALEQSIHHGKRGALATGDLEAAQRYHTALGLIYAERGAWRSSEPAFSAAQQLTWALDKADERREREGYYQPLPELKVLLARGLDSIGEKVHAADVYTRSALAFMDTDDLTSADSALQHAGQIRGELAVAGTRRLLALRMDIGLGGATAVAACSAAGLAAVGSLPTREFLARQRFKVLADCSQADSARGQEHALVAFRLADSARVTLIGQKDVARFEGVVRRMLSAVGMQYEMAHLDPAPAKPGPEIRVTLPGGTKPLWLTASLDDIIGARVATVVARNISIDVANRVVYLQAQMRPSQALIARLRRLDMVSDVRIVGSPVVP